MKEKCLVKQEGKRCPRISENGCHGQCRVHFNHFSKKVRARKITWDILFASGEAIPFKPYKKARIND